MVMYILLYDQGDNASLQMVIHATLKTDGVCSLNSSQGRGERIIA